MSNPTLDPAQERRRLRAAQTAIQHRQQWAVGAFVVGMGCVYAYVRMPPEYSTAGLMLAIAAPVITAAGTLPFLRMPCPQCGQRYQSLGNLFTHPGQPGPCKSCGFHIDKHVSRY
jgi:hypothetical protein